MANEKAVVEEAVHADSTQKDFALEARKVKALEKIAINLEALVVFCESLEVQDWSERIQWYLDMTKKAYLDPKLEK